MDSGRTEPLLIKETEKYSLIKAVKSLNQNPREFWILFILEIVSLIPFSIVVITMAIYNTRILGFTDRESGMIIGIIGLSVAVFSILFSSLPARYGLKVSLLISSSLGMFYFLMLYQEFSREIQVVVSFFVFIPCAAIGFISLKLGVKLFTYPNTRSLGYSMFYMVFFIAGGTAAGISDIVLSYYGISMNAFDLLFKISFGFYSLLFIISLPVRNIDIEETGENEIKYNRTESAWAFTKEVLVTWRFWKFFILVILLTVIKSMFFHLTATLPLYMYRSFGEGTHFSLLMVLHKIVLLIFIPLMTGLLRYYNFYSLLQIGSFITSLSPLFLLIEESFFTLSLFVVFLSTGEAIYAPRLVDYTISAAPKGKESIYLGLANMPNSLGLVITGVSSGLFLANFCPENGEKRCYLVWVYIGVYCIAACLFICIFRSFFEEKDQESLEDSQRTRVSEENKPLLID